LDLMQARAKYGKNSDKGYSLQRALSVAKEGTVDKFDTTKGGKLPHMATGTIEGGASREFERKVLNSVNVKEITIIIHWLEQALIPTTYHCDEATIKLKRDTSQTSVSHEKNVSKDEFAQVAFPKDNPGAGGGLAQMVDNLLLKRCGTLDML